MFSKNKFHPSLYHQILISNYPLKVTKYGIQKKIQTNEVKKKIEKKGHAEEVRNGEKRRKESGRIV